MPSADRLQRRLQDGGLVGAGALGFGQADIVAHQQGGGDQQDAQSEERRPQGEADLQIFRIAAAGVAQRQQAALLGRPGGDFLAQRVHALLAPPAGRPSCRRRRRPPTGCVVESGETLMDQGFEPDGAALLDGIIHGQAAGKSPRSAPIWGPRGAVGIEGNPLCGSAGSRAGRSRRPARHPGPIAAFRSPGKCGAPSLGRAFIGGELEGEIGHRRQDEKTAAMRTAAQDDWRPTSPPHAEPRWPNAVTRFSVPAMGKF